MFSVIARSKGNKNSGRFFCFVLFLERKNGAIEKAGGLRGEAHEGGSLWEAGEAELLPV